MKTRSHLALVAGALALCFLCVGQETRSMIYGRVLDPQSTALAGAIVTVKTADSR